MKLLKLIKNDKVICSEIEDASNFVTRFMGLMYRKSMPENHGLLLTPCNEIHTFGMRFDIDTVSISKEGKVLFIDESVKPNKIRKKVKDCYMVLELNGGICKKYDINVGDVLKFTPAN